MKDVHDRVVDWYLLGVIMYDMLVGIPPYYSQNRQELLENIKSGPLLIPKSMSESAKSLIKELLCRNPKRRLGAINDAVDIKAHVWFKGVDWNMVELKLIVPPAYKVMKIDIGLPMEMKFDKNIGSDEVFGEDFEVKNWSVVMQLNKDAFKML